MLQCFTFVKRVQGAAPAAGMWEEPDFSIFITGRKYFYESDCSSGPELGHWK